MRPLQPGEAIIPDDPWQAAMRRGDHEAAWAVSDAILAARNPAERDDPRLPYHLRSVWDGRDFRGRRVLVRCYHGLGDTLQFARYLAPLRAEVASLTLEVQPELLPLLTTQPAVDRLIAFDPAYPAPPSDCDIEIMELFHALRLPPAALPPPHLPTIRQTTGGIGLCWQAGNWDPDRSIPPARLTALCTRYEMRSLHPNPAPPELTLLDAASCPPAITDTAALIAGLDLVITVDTMIAHLAGTLNRSTWLLLKHDADWRWGQDRRRSAWYPSLRLYRQPAPGAWAPVLDEVARDLAGQVPQKVR